MDDSTPLENKAAEDVSNAARDVEKSAAAAEEVPESAMSDVLVSLKDVLLDIRAELSRSNQQKEQLVAAIPTPELIAPLKPKPVAVKVEVPHHQRDVRRNGRRLKR